MKRLFTTILFFISFKLIFAQEVAIEITRTEIPSNEFFQISAVVTNDRLAQCSNFPEIAGFVKSSRSTSAATTIINGKMTSKQSVVQSYQASREGTFVLKPFTMTINGKTANCSGATIKVGGAQDVVYDPFGFPMSSMFSNPRAESASDFVDIKADAFFAVTTDKSSVYVGEGFNMTVAFYISDTNEAIMDFSNDIGQQLAEILKKIKPKNCWEENFGINEISPERAIINGKTYRQYKLYQASYYPLNTEMVVIPSVGFKMVNFKLSRQQSIFGRSHVKDEKIFYSKAKEINIKALPPHPLQDQIAVGNYRLEEKINKTQASTGQSVNYKFEIQGEGNIHAINKPILPEKKNFDFYPPNVQQQLARNQNMVMGSKMFNYMMIPNEPGAYDLGNYFQWIFFNTNKGTYDTLRSQIKIMVDGESRMNANIESSDLGTFYGSISQEDNEIRELKKGNLGSIFVNISMIAMACGLAWVVFRKKA